MKNELKDIIIKKFKKVSSPCRIKDQHMFHIHRMHTSKAIVTVQRRIPNQFLGSHRVTPCYPGKVISCLLPRPVLLGVTL